MPTKKLSFHDGSSLDETLNLASVNNLPVIFVIENNLFSSHMDILKRPADKDGLNNSGFFMIICSSSTNNPCSCNL